MGVGWGRGSWGRRWFVRWGVGEKEAGGVLGRNFFDGNWSVRHGQGRAWHGIAWYWSLEFGVVGIWIGTHPDLTCNATHNRSMIMILREKGFDEQEDLVCSQLLLERDALACERFRGNLKEPIWPVSFRCHGTFSTTPMMTRGARSCKLSDEFPAARSSCVLAGWHSHR
jgi:hypothetical protein